MTATTEIIVVGGDRFRVEGAAEDVGARIIDAARGSMMEFVWLVEVESGVTVGLNPERVVALRASA